MAKEEAKDYSIKDPEKPKSVAKSWDKYRLPSCTHSVSQEMALVIGAVDVMVVDYQCIMPSMAGVAECT